MKKMPFMRGISLLLAVILTSLSAGFFASAENTVVSTVADGINVTRWADLMVVYTDRPTTGQNQYGHNCVIDSNGICTEIILGGDIKGENLAIPEGGMVVSATGVRVAWLEENIKLGSYVRFDSVTMRVMVSDTDHFPVTFSTDFKITGYNGIRYDKTVIIYNMAGQTTGTNGYGYEVVVSCDGYIVAAGGNDNTVPEGGYVISVITPEDKASLKSCGLVGASCVIKNGILTVSYDESAVNRRAGMIADELKAELERAKNECRIIDYSEAIGRVTAVQEYINDNDITTIAAQKTLSDLVSDAYASMYESKSVEVRSVWYEPLEKDAEGVAATVKMLSDMGINQLCLGIPNSYGTPIPLPDTFPFSQAAGLRGFDLLGEYVERCHENGIELVVSIPVFYNAHASHKKDWITDTNNGTTGEKELFYSPANDEFFEYFLSYVEYILSNYEVDGLQLDYIRYPYYDGTTDYGYDSATKKLFEEKTGISSDTVDAIAAGGSSHEKWNDWVDFKAGIVTDRVSQINSLVDSLRPDVYLSVCLAADYYYLAHYCQDGKTWVESGIVDAIYPMSYSEGIMAEQTKYFSSFDGDYYLIEGSGSYLSYSKEVQLQQVLETRTYGAEGIAFFELGAYISHGYSDYLNQSVFSESAVSPTYDPDAAYNSALATADTRAEKALEYGFITQAELDAFKADHGLGVFSSYSETAWYKSVEADLALAEKINAVKKPTDAVMPDKDGDSDTDDTESVTSAAVSEPSDTAKSDSDLPLIVAAAVTALLVIIAAALVMKKRK